MKKRLFLASLTLPALVHAMTLGELFDALKNQPQTRADAMLVKEANVGLKSVYAKLYPQIGAFASYDYYSTATGMLPVPPNRMFPMIQDQTIPQPFSKNISRIGATVSMPIFVKSIFTYADKTKKLKAAVKAKKRINLLKNEAVIVGANANLHYLDAMQKALLGKRNSLLKTKSFVQIKVDSGRAPKAALFKIDDALSQVDLALNAISLGRTKAIETIETLTGIRLKHPVSMHETSGLHTGAIGALEPLQKRVEADRLDLKAQKEKLYPSLMLKGSYNKSYADAYNNDKSIDEAYGNVGVVLKVPLLDKAQYTAIERSKIALQKERLQLAKEENSLTAQAAALKETLRLLKHSQALYANSVKQKERLRDIARVSLKAQRISMEDYLKYEDDLATQRAKLYQTKAQRWQALMQLAVIYTNNIEEIVQ